MNLTIHTFLLGLLGFIFWKFLNFLRHYWSYCQLMKLNKNIIPIGKFHPIWGHMHLFKDSGCMFQCQIDCVKKTKAKMMTAWVSHLYPLILTAHPDSVRDLLKSSEPKPNYYGSTYNSLKVWLGDGLLVSQGKKWERNRRLLTPAFHFDILKPYIQVYNDVAEILMKKFEIASTKEESFEIYDPVGLATFDTMLRCAFSRNEDVQHASITHPYVHAVKELGRLSIERIARIWQHWYPLYCILPSGQQFHKHSKFVHDFDMKVIKARMEAIEKDHKLVEKKHLDFLDILLTARDAEGEGLTLEEIRAEVDTFLFEGHDTTASAISWAIYALAQNQEEQEKVYTEVQKVLGDHPYVEWDDIHQMKQLNMFIKESMRYYSPVPGISRILTKDTLIDGSLIPKNLEIWINIHVMNTREDVWENPKKFDPERFEETKVKDRDPYMFVPFSAGPRNCIGQHFALDEIKVTLIKLLQKFKVTIDPDNIAVPYPEIVMRSEHNGIHVHFMKR